MSQTKLKEDAQPKAAANGKAADNGKANADNDGQENEGHVGSEELRDSPMMAHLLDALENGTDIGHYGRLTFAMVARHFMDEDELVNLLAGQPDQDESRARALYMQVQGRDYNPPKRERILEWQAQQDFPICPTPDDPASCNVYRELRLPDHIYDNIAEFYEERAGEDDDQK